MMAELERKRGREDKNQIENEGRDKQTRYIGMKNIETRRAEEEEEKRLQNV